MLMYNTEYCESSLRLRISSGSCGQWMENKATAKSVCPGVCLVPETRSENRARAFESYSTLPTLLKHQHEDFETINRTILELDRQKQSDYC